jgi:hypothetical protein
MSTGGEDVINKEEPKVAMLTDDSNAPYTNFDAATKNLQQ